MYLLYNKKIYLYSFKFGFVKYAACNIMYVLRKKTLT